MYMVRLLVATVNWHKSLQFAKKSNITLLPCLFMILLAVLINVLRLGIHFFTGAQVLRCVFPLPYLYHKLVMQ